MHTNEEIDYVSQSLTGFRTLLGGLTTLADFISNVQYKNDCR